MNNGAELTILLLEDMALIRQMLRDKIGECVPRATIHEVSSYDEAVRAAESLTIDIAFLDIELKRARTGIDVLRTLQEQGRAKHAIMLSETYDDAVVVECLGLGASGYVHKDAPTTAVLGQAIDVVLRGGIFLPQGLTGSRNDAAPQSATSLDQIGVTGRPREALYYLCKKGYSNKLIADKMGVAEATVANQYMTKLFKAFGVKSRLKLVLEVARRGLILPEPRACADERGTDGSSR